MTIEEVKAKFGDKEGYIYCEDCPCNRDCTHYENCTGWDDAYKYIIEHLDDEEDEDDIINHPNHYCAEGAMESIDEMVLVFGKEAVKNFCLCNVWKYRYRAPFKNGEEDIAKSHWYMKKYAELCEED